MKANENKYYHMKLPSLSMEINGLIIIYHKWVQEKSDRNESERG